MPAYSTAARSGVAVDGSVMKAAGPAAEVVDRTDELDTADTAVKTEDTAVRAADDIAVFVDDVYNTAAADGTYLQRDAHSVSVFGMNRPLN